MDSNSTVPTAEYNITDQSHYNRSLWEWTNNQLKQFRRKSNENYAQLSGYKPRTHQQERRQAAASHSSSCEA
jgi:hypothetical protein